MRTKLVDPPSGIVLKCVKTVVFRKLGVISETNCRNITEFSNNRLTKRLTRITEYVKFLKTKFSTHFHKQETPKL